MSDFWDYLDNLMETCPLVVDRPKNSVHPRFPQLVYPLDYGYLKGTSAGDGSGVDVWVGSQSCTRIDAGVLTIDLVKRDIEFKILYGCSKEEIDTILAFHNDASMRALLVRREG
jgi:inorganic pyrophosphatase